MANIIKLKNKTTTGTIVENLEDREMLVNNVDSKAFVRINETLKEFLFDEDLRGGALSTKERINTISNFASPNAGGVISGQFYDNSFHGGASGTLASRANGFDLAPYYTSTPITIDTIGCSVSTGSASSLFKIVIYSSSINGFPENLLYESGDLSSAAAGFFGATLNFTFQSGTQYYLGVRTSSTSTLRTIPITSAVNMGLLSSSATSYTTILRRTITYATAAPAIWNFVNADRIANITPPSIRFRAV
jgi:hypothetical protein